MMTGLKINFHKLFAYNLSGTVVVGTRVASILNCNLGSLPFTYLGLPIKSPLLEMKICNLSLRESKKDLQLGKVGRLILVNSVFSSMSFYYMSFYFLPEWVIHVIDHIHHAFFWKGARSIHSRFFLINWKLVCSHKNQVVWVFAISDLFNLALLSKWWWRFFNDSNAPWVGLVIQNYYRRRRVQNLHIPVTGHVFPFWRGVLETSTAYISSTHIVVGNGHSTRFWLDHWMRNDALASLFPNLFALARDPSTMVIS